MDLKLASLQGLSHSDFFALWGKSDVTVFDEHYHRSLRSLLQPASADFFDRHGHQLFAQNIMFAGTSGFAARLLKWPVQKMGIASRMAAQLSEPPRKNVGAAILRGSLSFWSVWKWLAPLGGVPESQLNLLSRDPRVWIDRVIEVLSTRMWLPGNYLYDASHATISS